MTNPAPNLLTVEEVAARLRVSAKTVRRLCSRVEIDSIRVGHQLRIEAESVDRYVASHRVRRVAVNPRRAEAWN